MGTALRIIAKYIAAKLLFVAWFLTTTSPVLLLMIALRGHEDRLRSLAWITLPWLGFSLVASWVLAHSTAHYILDENHMFLEAVKRSWLDLRLKLAFVPLVGHLFTPDEDKTHHDHDDD
jgi:hypothetical protein